MRVMFNSGASLRTDCKDLVLLGIEQENGTIVPKEICAEYSHVTSGACELQTKTGMISPRIEEQLRHALAGTRRQNLSRCGQRAINNAK